MQHVAVIGHLGHCHHDLSADDAGDTRHHRNRCRRNAKERNEDRVGRAEIHVRQVIQRKPILDASHHGAHVGALAGNEHRIVESLASPQEPCVPHGVGLRRVDRDAAHQCIETNAAGVETNEVRSNQDQWLARGRVQMLDALHLDIPFDGRSPRPWTTPSDPSRCVRCSGSNGAQCCSRCCSLSAGKHKRRFVSVIRRRGTTTPPQHVSNDGGQPSTCDLRPVRRRIDQRDPQPCGQSADECAQALISGFLIQSPLRRVNDNLRGESAKHSRE